MNQTYYYNRYSDHESKSTPTPFCLWHWFLPKVAGARALTAFLLISELLINAAEVFFFLRIIRFEKEMLLVTHTSLSVRNVDIICFALLCCD